MTLEQRIDILEDRVAELIDHVNAELMSARAIDLLYRARENDKRLLGAVYAQVDSIARREPIESLTA